ncbi:phosphotransferase [Kribbella sp. NBC_01505]|uniref:phosphotransferase enzyme family protein n=1 Tax=Kribbella sp. NBC_01505 TaxID=2903580 RepID=UPI0038709609
MGLPSAISAPERGTNNWVRFLRFGTDDYVFRLQRNADPRQVAAEQRLLTELRQRGLSFDVPAALPATDGATAVATPLGLATLCRRLPGSHPARGLPELEAIGRALGELDVALAELPHELAPNDWRRPLATIRPEITDFDELGRALRRELPGAATDWFVERVPEIDAATQELRQRLPVQIVHSDLGPSNLLIADGQVSAVLDFEIAGLDLRIADFVVSLGQSTDRSDPDQVAAFRRGYAAFVVLSDLEEAALPTMSLQRALGSVIWRAGVWRSGHATAADVLDRLTAAYELQG